MDIDWQSKTKRIAERCTRMYRSKEHADCAFEVGSEKSEVVTAHKLILAMSSSVFDTMFFGALPEDETPILVPDIEPKIFDAMLRYIYMEEVDVDVTQDILDLWVAADKYLLLDLAAQCAKKLLFLVNTDNVWDVFHYATLYDNKDLKGKCDDIIAYDCDFSITSCFVDVNLEKLKLILEAKMLKVKSEVEVFNALAQWAKTECKRQSLPEVTENLRSVSAGCVEKIRFLTMTSKEFVNGPCLSPLLTKDEAYCIMYNLPQPEKFLFSRVPLPKGFSSSLISRVAEIQKSIAVLDTSIFKKIGYVPVYDEQAKRLINITKGHAFFVSFCLDKSVAVSSITLEENPGVSCEYTVLLINPEMKVIGSWKVRAPGFNDEVIFTFPNGPLDIPKNQVFAFRVVVDYAGDFLVGSLGTAQVKKAVELRRPDYSSTETAQVTLGRHCYDPYVILSAIVFVSA